jgi:hypothetical protein
MLTTWCHRSIRSELRCSSSRFMIQLMTYSLVLSITLKHFKCNRTGSTNHRSMNKGFLTHLSSDISHLEMEVFNQINSGRSPSYHRVWTPAQLTLLKTTNGIVSSTKQPRVCRDRLKILVLCEWLLGYQVVLDKQMDVLITFLPQGY